MNRSLHHGIILATTVLGLALSGEARADTYDRQITLVNRSHQTITEFHASNVGSDNWEEDILGDLVLPPGYSVRINLNDGTGYCQFDFKTVTRDGDAIVRRGVNVCELATYTLTD